MTDLVVLPEALRKRARAGKKILTIAYTVSLTTASELRYIMHPTTSQGKNKTYWTKLLRFLPLLEGKTILTIQPNTLKE